jgi:DNA-binding response OmpR family regulator
MESANVSILLVDDSPDALELYRTVLGDLGLNLITAQNGEEALRLVKDNEFAAIVLDIQMPGIDGYETAIRIRSLEKSRQTPIIFVTGNYKDEQSAARGYALGAADYITKPFRVDAFRGKIQAYAELFRRTRKVLEQMRTAVPGVERERVLVAHSGLAPLFKSAGWPDKLGVEILECNSIKDATEWVKKGVDLVILGSELSDGDGFEVARFIRQNEEYATLPIILITGQAPGEDVLHKGFEAGAVDVLPMPVNLDLLRAKVQALLSQFRQIRSLKQQYQEIERLKSEIENTRKRLLEIESELDRLASLAV